MKVRAFNFISYYLNDSYKEYVQEYLHKNGKEGFQPQEWKNDNPLVPKNISKSSGAIETYWILIRYEGAFDTLSITDDYVHDLRGEYQRAIAIDFTKDTVSWRMFKNSKGTNLKYMQSFKR